LETKRVNNGDSPGAMRILFIIYIILLLLFIYFLYLFIIFILLLIIIVISFLFYYLLFDIISPPLPFLLSDQQLYKN